MTKEIQEVCATSKKCPKGKYTLVFLHSPSLGQNIDMLTAAGAAILDYEVALGMGAMLFRAKRIKLEGAQFLDTIEHYSSSLGLLT